MLHTVKSLKVTLDYSGTRVIGFWVMGEVFQLREGDQANFDFRVFLLVSSVTPSFYTKYVPFWS